MSARRWTLALSLTCQFALVALAAYPMLGCDGDVVGPGDDGSCEDSSWSVPPGGCSYITSALAGNCGSTIWNTDRGSVFSLLDHKDEFYVIGGTATGDEKDVAICAREGLEYDAPVVVLGQVEYDETVYEEDVGLVETGERVTAAANLRLTINYDFACDRSLCVGVGFGRTGPNTAFLTGEAGPPFGLPEKVEQPPSGFQTMLWTSDPPGGIPEGQEDDINVQVTFTEDTTYTLTVEGFDTYGVWRTASYSVLAEFQGGAAPVAVDDVGIYAIEEGGTLEVDSSIGVLENDSDPDTPLAELYVNNYTVPAQGGEVYLEVDGSFTYIAPPGFNGYDSFTYTISDGLSTSNEATVEITVGTPPNEPPVGVADEYSVDEGTTLVTDAATGVLWNDSDLETDHGALTVEVIDPVASGNLLLLNQDDGSFTYTPDPDFHGTDTFTYAVSDGTATTGPVPVTITVTPVNDPPVADAGADINIRVDRLVQLDGTGSSDIDGPNPLTYQWSFILPLPGGSNADLTLATTPTPRFTPDAVGTYRLLLQVSDGEASDTDEVSVIAAANAAPTALGETYSVDEDGLLDVAAAGDPPGVLWNDKDPDGDPISAELVSGPSDGKLTPPGLNPDGSFQYTPNGNFNGQDSFTYRASDGDLASGDTTVTINVTAINDAPTVVAHDYVTEEDVDLVVVAPGLLVDAFDADSDSLTVEIVDGSGPSSGSIVGLNPVDGSFQYVPASNFNGTVSFTYTASDETVTTEPAVVTIEITPVVDPPIAVAGSDDVVRTGRLASLDGSESFDPDSGAPITSFQWTFVSVPEGSGITDAAIAGATTAFASFTPDVAGTYTLRLQVSNGSGDSATDEVVVVATNSAPDSLDDTYEIDEDGSLTVIAALGVLENDTDPEGDPLTASVVTGPTSGELVFNPDGSFVYTPVGNFNGTASFTYVASDAEVSGDAATVTITVRPVNDPPTVTGDAYLASEDTTLTASIEEGVLENDEDIDEEDTLTATLVSNASNGNVALAADGSFVYTPNGNFNGPDSFSYTASDGTVSTAPPTVVTLNVAAVNDAPVANAGPDREEAVGLSVPLDGTGSSDVDGDPLTYQWSFTQVPPGSSASIANPTSANASFVPDLVGQYTVQLVVNDGALDSAPDSASFEITVCSPTAVRWVPNASGQWSVAENWSTGAVPGPTDDVCIDVPAEITVSHPNVVSSIRSLVSEEHIALNSGTLTIAQPSIVRRSFTHINGTLAGAGDLTVTGPFEWRAGVQSGSGRTIGAGGTTFAQNPGPPPSSPSRQIQGRTIVNPAGQTATLASGLTFTGDFGEIVNNGTFTITFDATVNSNLGTDYLVFRNAGMLQKTGGTGTSDLSVLLDNQASGVITSSSGTLRFSRGGASAGRFEGSGTIAFGGATTMDLNGVHAVQGATRIDGTSQLSVNLNTSTVLGFGGRLEIAGGSLVLNNTTPVVANEFVQSASGATLTGPGTLRVTGPMTWSGGTQSGTGQTIAEGGMTLNSAGVKNLSARRIVNPSGQTAVWTQGNINSGDGAVFVNGGTFSVDIDGTTNYSWLHNLGGTRTGFQNSGTLTLERTGATGGQPSLAFALESTGVVRALAGAVLFNGGYVQTGGTTELAGGSINAIATLPLDIRGGRLVGSGTVSPRVVSAGTVAPAATGPLSITGTPGSYAQGATGTLEIELSGTETPGIDYDQLTVSQAATLGGALNVSLANGFVPVAGDSFTIMTYGSATGAFSSQSLPPLGGGLSWNVSVGATALTLSVVP